MNRPAARLRTFPCAVAALLLGIAGTADAADRRALSVQDYRYFRALSIDLSGRIPTRAEIAAFEKPAFDLDAWIEERLGGDGYAERLTRLYMDVLRLDPNPAAAYLPPTTTLLRAEVQGPGGKPIRIFYRAHQRRARPETDGEFCLSKDETGLEIDTGIGVRGTAKPVTRAAIEASTVLVKPWWLYADYRAKAPAQRYNATWHPDAQFQLADGLITEPDKSATVEIRVCKEEAQTADAGHIRVTNHKAEPKGSPPPPARWRVPPPDPSYVRDANGQTVSCRTRVALETAPDCGCGIGLEHCMPGLDVINGGRPFDYPTRLPLGSDVPMDMSPQPGFGYFPYWWGQEARQFLSYLWQSDRDFREVLTGRWTIVNGPVAQYYRSIAPGNCCTLEAYFGLLEDKSPLAAPSSVPPDLLPFDTKTWKVVADRGPRAAGILTTSIFLQKYASNRARGAALYSSFLCRTFSTDDLQLEPSNENDLTKRPGCSTCHATLEPLAAYFARIEAGNPIDLPAEQFPVENPDCRRNANGTISGKCGSFYDPAFTDEKRAVLRGAYASYPHANEGPIAAAREIVQSDEFARCAVSRVGSSLVGRELGTDDQPLLDDLLHTFRANGFKMRALVRAIVKADAYRRANGLGGER